MYIIKQNEQQSIQKLSAIVQTLAVQKTFDKKDFNDAKTSVRQARYLVNLILDRWEEERTFA